MQTIPQEQLSNVREWLLRDRFRGRQGPTVPRYFSEGLNRIDPRLVLRWSPGDGLYLVWLEVSPGMLWPRPVHAICETDGGYRCPCEFDLSEIRKAAWIAFHGGSKEIDERANQFDAVSEKTREDHDLQKIREVSRTLCQEYDLTYKDFNVVRKSFSDGRRMTP